MCSWRVRDDVETLIMTPTVTEWSCRRPVCLRRLLRSRGTQRSVDPAVFYRHTTRMSGTSTCHQVFLQKADFMQRIINILSAYNSDNYIDYFGAVVFFLYVYVYICILFQSFVFIFGWKWKLYSFWIVINSARRADGEGLQLGRSVRVSIWWTGPDQDGGCEGRGGQTVRTAS